MAINSEPVAEFDVQYYLRTLQRQKVVIVLAIAAVLGATLFFSFRQTPLYASHSDVYVRPEGSGTLFGSAAYVDPIRAIENEILVLGSEAVIGAATKSLGFFATVSASGVGSSDVIRIRATNTSPERAAAIANAFALSYVEYRQTQAVRELLAAGDVLQAKIEDLQERLEDLPTAPDGTVGNERAELLQQQALYKQRLDQLQVDTELKNGGAQIVSTARVPSAPVSPNKTRNAQTGLVIGLILGLSLAFLREYLDDAIRSKGDVELAGRGMPVIGLIPHVGAWKNRKESRLVSISAPGSAAAEAYRGLRTSVQFMGIDRPMKRIQVTSANASEGKTTTLANLAVTIAQSGKRVVVVCCDLRRPRVHEYFDVSNRVGITSVLLGDKELHEALQPVAGRASLAVLASGPLPLNPSEILASPRAVAVFDQIAASCDVMLIDCPPVLPVTDAIVISRLVDATLLVATAGSTSRRTLRRAVEVLTQVSAPLCGIVLNGVPGEAAYAPDYGYYYDTYGVKDRRARRRRRWRGSGSGQRQETVSSTL